MSLQAWLFCILRCVTFADETHHSCAPATAATQEGPTEFNEQYPTASERPWVDIGLVRPGGGDGWREGWIHGRTNFSGLNAWMIGGFWNLNGFWGFWKAVLLGEDWLWRLWMGFGLKPRIWNPCSSWVQLPMTREANGSRASTLAYRWPVADRMRWPGQSTGSSCLDVLARLPYPT